MKNNSRSFSLLFSVIFAIFTNTAIAQVSIQEVKTTIVDERALSISGQYGSAINGKTFQKDIIATYRDYQYLAYYDSDRRVCLSRRKLPEGIWETIRFMDYKFESNDSHNVISMGICPNDGTIHLAFDHHVDPLHYKVSKIDMVNDPDNVDWSERSFKSVSNELENGKPIKITYPKFWPTPDGDLQFCYRIRGSGNGDRMLVDYDASTGEWKNTRQLDDANGFFEDQIGTSESRCSYPNGYDYDDNGRLHTTWVWRENSQSANHDLMYAYSDDQGFTWKNNSDEVLREVININSPNTVVRDIPRVTGLMNDHGQAIDSKGRIHAVMYHCTEASIIAAGSTMGASRWGPDEAKRYFHYWRDQNGKWQEFEMSFKVGNRPKIFADDSDNLIMIYGGNEETGDDNYRHLIIAVATADNMWQDWQVAGVIKGPFFNEMHGDIYRWQKEGILSVMVQENPEGTHEPSVLKVVDLRIDL